jgi:hypothetical protein
VVQRCGSFFPLPVVWRWLGEAVLSYSGCTFPAWSILRWPVLAMLSAVLGDRRCSG